MHRTSEFADCFERVKDIIGELKLEKTQLELKLGAIPTDATKLIGDPEPADQLEDVSADKNVSCCYCLMFYNRESNRQKLQIINAKIAALEELNTKYVALLGFKTSGLTDTWADALTEMGLVIQSMHQFGARAGITQNPFMLALEDFKTTLAKYDKHHIVMQGRLSPTRLVINDLHDLVKRLTARQEHERLSDQRERGL